MPYKQLKINFIGNTQVGMTGEMADEVLLVNSLRKHGQVVNFIPRDVWREHCRGEHDDNWNQYLNLEADINIICKWHAFDDPMYIRKLKEKSGARALVTRTFNLEDQFTYAYSKIVGLQTSGPYVLKKDYLFLQYDGYLFKLFGATYVSDSGCVKVELGDSYEITNEDGKYSIKFTLRKR
jgi:hypothetical protein